jgi:D-ribose pyranase
MIGKAFMAEEFRKNNSSAVQKRFSSLLQDVKINFEPHVEFKKRVPFAIGLIRTADTTQYGNIIIESA